MKTRNYSVAANAIQSTHNVPWLRDSVMINGTVANGEDVNQTLSVVDALAYSASNEIANVLSSYGITPSNTSDYQLLEALRTKLITSGGFMSGVVYDSITSVTAPYVSGSVIKIPAMQVRFNTKSAYFGKTESDFKIGNILAQDFAYASGMGSQGSVYIYASAPAASGGTATISWSTTQTLGSEGATKVLLASVFIQGSAFQAGSLVNHPWEPITNAKDRQTSSSVIDRATYKATGLLVVSRSACTITKEGINIWTNAADPDNKAIVSSSEITPQKLYPGYTAGTTGWDVTHAYNKDTGVWTNIATSGAGKYMVLVPGVTWSGQDVYIPATTDALFNTMDEAQKAINSLTYVNGNVASRVVYPGVSFIVKVGATDFTDKSQFGIVNLIPPSLSSAISTQAGGGISISGLTAYDYDGNVVGNPNSITELVAMKGFTLSSSTTTRLEIGHGTQYQRITDLGIKTSNFEVTVPYLSSPAGIFVADLSTASGAVQITITESELSDMTGTDSATFELHLIIGSVVPTITFSTSTPISWVDGNTSLGLVSNKTGMITFRRHGTSKLLANPSGVY